MDLQNLLIEDRESCRIITVNRPDKLNALNRQTIGELSLALKDGDEAKNVRVMILTGSGEKAFVAGADIAEFAKYSVEEGKALSADGHDKLFNLIDGLSTPVIAAVNGFALGGGLELAMSCHIRYASDNARLGLPEVSLGVIPGYGGTQRLAQLVGRGKASEMVLSGGMISAEDAKSWGLVNEVVSQKELLPACLKLAGRISGNSPRALAFALQAIQAGYDKEADALKREVELFGESFGTEDFTEGTTAFLEKRKANFTGN
jgi:enoyl-CoA hydratase